jgi:glucose-6-phosphate dehydrogenase assembly protein OpcA
VLIGGRLGPGEAVVMRMYGRLALHAESVVLPLLAPDAPVVTWWYGEPPNRIAHDPLGVFADRRITDCSLAVDPMAAFRRRADDYAPGDTDLGWTRTTMWRALCASAFDSVTGAVTRVQVTGAPGHVTRALLAGWLARRLGLEVELQDAEGGGLSGVEIVADDVTVALTRGRGNAAVLSRSGQPDHTLPLPRRELGDLLAEELRRLDPDEPYAEALEAATGTTGLSDRPATRTHVWHDPLESDDPDPALTVS